MELQFELMIFTLFVCLGAGIFAIQGLLSLLGKGEKIQLPALVAALGAIAVGGLGSFLHLQHWERIFNGFGHLSSGITQELIAIVVFVVALVVYFIMIRRQGTDGIPKWCAGMAIAISIVLVFVMAHSYNMAARPVWDTPVLWFYYLSNAAFFGSLTVALIAGITKDSSSALVTKVAFFSGIAQVAMTAIYAIFFAIASASFTSVGNYFDPTHPTKTMADPASVFSGIFTGEHALLFWLGVVIVGLLVPLLAAFLSRKKEGTTPTIYLGVGLVCALIGGMCMRVVLYVLGLSVFMFY
jgi:DMSO reductase anchor subunit